MKTFLTYLTPHRKRMILQFTIKFVASIMDLFLPWLLAFMIDDIVPLQRADLIYLYGAFMILCALVAVFGNITANRMSIGISRDITEKLRHDLFEKTINLSAQQSDEVTLPSLISRLSSDTYHVHQMIDRMQRLGIRAPILLLGGIVLTLTMEPVLALVLISTLPILWILVYHISKKGILLYGKTQKANDQLVRKVQENITGIRVIKALSKTEIEKEKFDQANQDLVLKDQAASQVMALTSPAMTLLLNLGITGVILVGAFRVNQGLTQPGQIIAFLSYFTIILTALLMVTRIFTLYSRGAASANRIEEILLLPSTLNVESIPAIKRDYHIEFRDVSFSYNKVQNNVEKINFALKPGESLGIIGETGSGKSTILQLLLRFYEADEGEILIDGRNVKSIPKEELYRFFGVAFQQDLLYADTIAENIAFGRPLSTSAIETALDHAQARFVFEKPDGIHHRLTIKGANLSGGQKQRILLARALAGNPKILVLDDSASALDYITEAALRSAIARHYPHTTTIIVAQRVSSIKRLDKILVIEEGHIIGAGSHEELVQTCESYREIYETQMGEIHG